MKLYIWNLHGIEMMPYHDIRTKNVTPPIALIVCL